MRWLKRSDEVTESAETALRAAYRAHLLAIEPSFQPDLLALSRLSLHDGLIEKLTVNEAKRTVTLRLLIGDQQGGYVHQRLKYREASVVARGAVLRWLVEYDATELLDDEIDVAGSSFVHRLLFWPAGEVHITFAAVDLTAAPASGRGRKRRTRLRWVDGPHEA